MTCTIFPLDSDPEAEAEADEEAVAVRGSSAGNGLVCKNGFGGT